MFFWRSVSSPMFFYFIFSSFVVLKIWQFFQKKRVHFLSSLHPKSKNLPQKNNYWHSSHVYLSIGYTINGHVQNYSQLIQKYYMLFFFHCLPLNPFTMNVARTYFDFRLCTFWPNYGQ